MLVQHGHMPAGASHRLFFAAWPDAPARERLAALVGRLKPDYPARWLRPSRHHLTLCFLGAWEHVPATLIGRAMQAADSVRMPALDWRPDRVGGFRAPRPPCVLRASTTDAGLQHLHRALLDACAARDIIVADRRPYVPHVTLGYGRQGRVIADRKVLAVDFPIHAFVLLHSVPGAGEYHELGRWPLPAA